ncbi:hypothetical protein L227DRAFT_235612 [Lentinus tigrinus ALCF2SS1-6]|uniref:F-box domain-containing protein n=1 Tax=Lentinus tigrinus ALCF2SS1-6 TaxID=1328759 RepID=A0A5C2S1L9_9APHY|nr:hypothetical protein L227DRAFT_235612 [Lentinus tigrinus ALCF2SS1-6]
MKGELIHYLPNDHALVYGATCSFLRPLAVRHAVADVVFNSATHLKMFCQFMLDDETRLPYLRKLVMLSGIPASSRFYACVGPLTRMLKGATNLSLLTLPAPDLLFDIEDGLRDIVASLEALTSLSLTSFGAESRKLLLQLRSAPRLQRLVISEQWTVYQNESRGSMILPPMTSLHTLILDGVRSPPLLSMLPVVAPAIRSLQVTNVTFWLEDLSQSKRAWWESLEHIRGDLHAVWSVRIPHPVAMLQVDTTLDPRRDWDPAPLYEMLAAASPKRLSIGMQARFNQPLWRTYAPAMPRLQYMELVVIESDPCSPDLEFWIKNMSEPGASALFALAIYIQRPSHDPVEYPLMPSAGPIDTQLSFRLQAALARSLQSLRILALSIGTHPAAREEHDFDMYSVFSGSEFNWWVSEDPSDSPAGGPPLAEYKNDEADHDAEDGQARSWRRVEEKKAVQLFAALRKANLVNMCERRTFLTLYT